MSIEDMTDEEIVEQINESLEEDGRVLKDFIKIECVKGKPVINGRVASDEQIQIVDEILSDVLEIENYDNNLWVDDELAFEGNEDAEATEELSFDDEDELESDESYGGEDDE